MVRGSRRDRSGRQRSCGLGGVSTGSFRNDAGNGFIHASVVKCTFSAEFRKDAVTHNNGDCVVIDKDGDKAALVWKCTTCPGTGEFQWTNGTGKYRPGQDSSITDGGERRLRVCRSPFVSGRPRAVAQRLLQNRSKAAVAAMNVTLQRQHSVANTAIRVLPATMRQSGRRARPITLRFRSLAASPCRTAPADRPPVLALIESSHAPSSVHYLYPCL